MNLNKDSNFFDRMLKVADLKGFKNLNDLAKALGYASAEKLYRLKRQENARPSYEILEDLTNKFEDLNLRWLVTGEGEIFASNSQKKVSTPPLNSANTPSRGSENDENGDATTLKIGEASGEATEKVSPNSAKNVSPSVSPTIAIQAFRTDFGGIPLIPISAVAGYGAETFEIVEKQSIEDWYSIPDFKDKKVDYMTRVDGDSMYNKKESKGYLGGDIVACRFINEKAFIQWGKVFVIDTISQGCVMKRLYKDKESDGMICRSDNEDYMDFVVPREDIRSISLVIGGIRLLS